jgi:hypothetical protein
MAWWRDCKPTSSNNGGQFQATVLRVERRLGFFQKVDCDPLSRSLKSARISAEKLDQGIYIGSYHSRNFGYQGCDQLRHGLRERQPFDPYQI